MFKLTTNIKIRMDYAIDISVNTTLFLRGGFALHIVYKFGKLEIVIFNTISSCLLFLI